MKNIGYYYYRQYFKGYDPDQKEVFEKELKKRNKELTGTRFDGSSMKFLAQEDAPSFFAVTQYPGLFTGSGMGHEIGTKGELKLGFYFDYTTGMPVIPASSVKGTLRSVFSEIEYIIRLITEHTDETVFPIIEIGDEEVQRVGAIEKEIFDGTIGGKPLSIYDRDLFFDAYISLNETCKCEIIGTDFITPHIQEEMQSYSRSILKNPTPLPFLKILPDIQFQFQFNLKDHREQNDQLLSVGQKRNLFMAILKDIGIGAKTNVGYGQFKTVSLEKKETPCCDHDDSQRIQLKTENRESEKTHENERSNKKVLVLKRPQKELIKKNAQ